MPLHITFTRKGQTEPEKLNKLDEELCGVLGVQPHPRRWVVGWFETIGYPLATGRSWSEVREWVSTMFDGSKAKNELEVIEFEETLDSWNKIVDHLEANFVIKSWR